MSGTVPPAGGGSAMLRETYELRAHAVDKLRVLLHEKLQREGLTPQALLDAGATTSTATPGGSSNNNNNSATSSSSNMAVSAASSSAHNNNSSSSSSAGGGSRSSGRRTFTCWLCGKTTSVIYRVRNTYELCFTCFRIFYVSAVLPLLDTAARRDSDVDFLCRIAMLQSRTQTTAPSPRVGDRVNDDGDKQQRHEPSSSSSGSGTHGSAATTSMSMTTTAAPPAAGGGGDGSDLWAMPGAMTTAPSGDSVFEVVDPSQASFVMNASVMLQRRTAAAAAAAAASAAGSNNGGVRVLGDSADYNSGVATRAAATAAARAVAPGLDAPASMWSCRQCTYINPETARVCEVCGCANIQSVTCRVCGKVCSTASLSSNGNGDEDKTDAAAAARATTATAATTTAALVPSRSNSSSHPNSSSNGSSSSSGGGGGGGGAPTTMAAAAGAGVCKDGRPHLLWFCTQCRGVNTLDGDVCALCQQPRYWICGYCTERHSAQRVVDGLRYCVTCGSYNTPDDLKKGQSKVEYEEQKQRERATSAATTATASSAAAAAAAAALAAAAGGGGANNNNSSSGGSAEGTVFGVNDADTLAQLRRQHEIADNEARLNERLRALQLARNVRKSDGNCLFAALANQLFGKASMCHTVRSMIVHYMRLHAEDYAVLFTAREWERYISQMRESGFWGDELCLNAAARCFHVDIHVITSDTVRWHIVFHHKDLSMSQSYRTRGGGGNNSNAESGAATSCADNNNVSSNVQHAGRRNHSGSKGSLSATTATAAANASSLMASLQQGLPAATHGSMTTAAEQHVRQGRDVVSPRFGAPDGVCVFLAYLSPVHYDDIGMCALPPIRLPDLFAKEVRQTLATLLPPPAAAAAAPASLLTMATSTTRPSSAATTAASAVAQASPTRAVLPSPLSRRRSAANSSHNNSASTTTSSGNVTTMTASTLHAQQQQQQQHTLRRKSSATHGHSTASGKSSVSSLPLP